MKRYTVKNVVKLENKAEYLSELDRQRLDDELFFPLALLFCLGMATSSLYFTGETQSVVPLITGGIAQLLGGGGYAYYSSTPKRLENLREKLNEIYKNMGAQFKEEVKEEVWNKKYGDSGRAR